MSNAFALIDSLKTLGIRTDNIQALPQDGSIAANLFLGKSTALPIVFRGPYTVSVENTDQTLAELTDCSLPITEDPSETARELRDLITGYYL